jgi:hypothetical protein
LLKEGQSYFALLLLLISLLVIVASTLDTNPEATGQTTAAKKKDIFKVLLTVDGIDHNSGDIVTVVSVNGESKVKLFDDTKTYIKSVNATDGTVGFIEYAATFPNATVKAGDEYKACALLVKDSNLMCQTGNNSPALRPESIDLHIQEAEQPTTDTTTEAGDEDEVGDEGGGEGGR